MSAKLAAYVDVELAQLHHLLAEHLQFRHVFRQAYAFQLRWEKMQALVEDCPTTLADFDAEFRQWLADLPHS